MKKIILLLCIFFLTGCTQEVNLEFKNNEVNSNLKISVTDIEYQNSDYYDDNYNSVKDYFSTLQIPKLYNSNEVYQKQDIKEKSDKIVLEYNTAYTFLEFENAYLLNRCFENVISKTTKDNLYLHLNGEFYCYFNEDIDLNFKTKYKIIESNYEKKKGNIYSWKINEENYEDVDILFVISKRRGVAGIRITVGIILALLIGACFFLYNKVYKNNLCN